MSRFYFLFLTMIGQLYSTAQESNVTIPMYEAEISLDGDLNESIWDSLSPMTNFTNHFPNDEGFADQQTEVRLFHNGSALYIGVVYHDVTAQSDVSTLKRDVYVEGIFLSDCFGIAIDPLNNKDAGYLFALNAKGVQYDALIGNSNRLNDSWNARWRGKTVVQGTDKIYEFEIPLEAINFRSGDQDWGIQFFVNDIKMNLISSFTASPRNFEAFDLRFTTPMKVEQLSQKSTNRFSVVPSLSSNYRNDKVTNTQNFNIQPSIDGQYNITSSLRLDVTLNPDFSQVDVDQQVTNLSRFAINFPERRKFFLENSDLFSNLGTFEVNPFYSRRVGAASDISHGMKLSGNIGRATRIGLINVATKSTERVDGQNYTVGVARNNFSKSLVGTAFIVNTARKDNYNRNAGANLDYRSNNGRWKVNTQLAQAFTSGESMQQEIATDKRDHSFKALAVQYDTKQFEWNASVQDIGKNYIAETGFIPFQYNFNSETNESIREGYVSYDAGFQVRAFPKDSKHVDWIRRFWLQSNFVFNEDGTPRFTTHFYSPFAIRFKDASYVYVAGLTRVDHLRYSFDFLGNGAPILPGKYIHTFGRTGYWSTPNKPFSYRLKFEYGQFYSGTRLNPQVDIVFRKLPLATISASYVMNKVSLRELGQRTFHLIRLTSEIYFNNQMNWTTYVQYNTQANNMNITSRVQWEYEPLSYIYLVATNNFNESITHQNWGVNFKVTKRFDF